VTRRFFVTLVLPDSGVASEFVLREADRRSAYARSGTGTGDSAGRWRPVRLTKDEILKDVRSIDLRIADVVGLPTLRTGERHGLAGGP